MEKKGKRWRKDNTTEEVIMGPFSEKPSAEKKHALFWCIHPTPGRPLQAGGCEQVHSLGMEKVWRRWTVLERALHSLRSCLVRRLIASESLRLPLVEAGMQATFHWEEKSYQFTSKTTFQFIITFSSMFHHSKYKYRQSVQLAAFSPFSPHIAL